MRILIATTQVPFVRGGAEILAEGLRDALCRSGHEAEIVGFPFKWYPADAIAPQVLAARLMDLSEYSGTRIDRVVGLKFPAYLIPHPRKSLWILHQHRAAYDFWESRLSDLLHMPGGRAARDFIRRADDEFLPEADDIFTISRNVSGRLKRFNGIDSEPLYHPPANPDRYNAGTYSDYLLFPSRIDSIKRQWLVVDALAHSKVSLRVTFVGAADNPSALEQLKARAREKGVEDRICWKGTVTEAEKVRLYADACAVLYPPIDEDYGYVTLEAMLAAKAVITCADSGGPLEFVQHGVTGLVAAPDAGELAAAMELLWCDRSEARKLGMAGRAWYERANITWEHVVERLCA